MRIGEAEKIAGTLGRPFKMPGFSTSTSATECKLGSRLRSVPGSVGEGFYAMGANYQYPSVKEHVTAVRTALMESISERTGKPLWTQR
jgi:hypothetical protein